MARIRTIKPEIWTSEQVVDCSMTARLAFIGLWNFCDDGGVHPASPRRLKMEVFPGDDLTTDDISALVDELIAAGLIKTYSVEDQEFWRVTGWHHQRIEKPNFRYPDESGCVPVADDSRSSRRAVDDSSPPEGKGREGKVGKGNSTTSRRFQPPTVEEVSEYTRSRSSSVDPARFVDFYESKGWKVGKNPMKDWKAAVRTWERDDPRPEPEVHWQ